MTKKNCQKCKNRNCSDIPMNKLEEGILYEFTISPCDTLQFFGQFQRTRLAVEAILNKLEILKFSTTYNLIWEYTDPLTDVSGGKENKPTSPPRLHLHGTIMINDMFELLESGLYSLALWSKYQFNPHCEKYWNRYIKKQRIYMEKGFKKHELPYEVSNSTMSKITRKKLGKTAIIKKSLVMNHSWELFGCNSDSD